MTKGDKQIMKLSARNQFAGTVVGLRHGPVNSEVLLDIGHGHTLLSRITVESAHKLGLQAGKTVHALFKAQNVVLTPYRPHAHGGDSPRLNGTVTWARRGDQETEVLIDLDCGQKLVAVTPDENAQVLDIREGRKISALVMAPSIFLGVE